MTRRMRMFALALLAVAGAPAQAGWFSSKDKVVESFLKPETVDEASLSPDGKHLAMVVLTANNDEIGTGLVVIDTNTGQSHLIRGPQREPDPDRSNFYYIRQPIRVAWMSDDVMAVDFNNKTSVQISTDGGVVGWLGSRFFGMLRLDGGKAKVALVKRYSDADNLGTVALGSKETEPLRFGFDSGPIDRLLTDSTGLVRVLQTIETPKDADVSRVVTWYRDGESDKWRKVIDQSITDDLVEPVFVSLEPDRLVVQARNGGDRLAMWNYDVEKKAFVDVAAAHPSEDIVAAEAETGTRDFKRVSTEGLKPQTVWFDSRMASLQASIDAALPGHVNELQGTPGTQMLVTTSSDVDPGKYLLLDTRSRIGDPTLMKTRFDAVSPLQHADLIKAPLLLVHGKLDERVSMSQGQQMYERMRALRKDVRWLQFDDEGHSLWRIEDQRDFYGAVFELLERTIGKGIAPTDARP